MSIYKNQHLLINYDVYNMMNRYFCPDSDDKKKPNDKYNHDLYSGFFDPFYYDY